MSKRTNEDPRQKQEEMRANIVAQVKELIAFHPDAYPIHERGYGQPEEVAALEQLTELDEAVNVASTLEAMLGDENGFFADFKADIQFLDDAMHREGTRDQASARELTERVGFVAGAIRELANYIQSPNAGDLKFAKPEIDEEGRPTGQYVAAPEQRDEIADTLRQSETYATNLHGTMERALADFREKRIEHTRDLGAQLDRVAHEIAHEMVDRFNTDNGRIGSSAGEFGKRDAGSLNKTYDAMLTLADNHAANDYNVDGNKMAMEAVSVAVYTTVMENPEIRNPAKLVDALMTTNMEKHNSTLGQEWDVVKSAQKGLHQDYRRLMSEGSAIIQQAFAEVDSTQKGTPERKEAMQGLKADVERVVSTVAEKFGDYGLDGLQSTLGLEGNAAKYVNDKIETERGSAEVS